jgi:hypothetical protein
MFKHVTKFPCVKQSPNSVKEAFYALHHMRAIVQNEHRLTTPSSTDAVLFCARGLVWLLAKSRDTTARTADEQHFGGMVERNTALGAKERSKEI